MQTSFKTRCRVARGFTLMEIMVVIAIIAILATMTVAGVTWYKRKAAENKTTMLIASVELGLEDYRADEGSLPVVSDADEDSTLLLYQALYGDLDGDGQPEQGQTVYLSSLDPNLIGSKLNVEPASNGYRIVDAWYEPLYYLSPGNMNPDFDLWSTGVNTVGGPDGTAEQQRDDITNWK